MCTYAHATTTRAILGLLLVAVALTAAPPDDIDDDEVCCLSTATDRNGTRTLESQLLNCAHGIRDLFPHHFRLPLRHLPLAPEPPAAPFKSSHHPPFHALALAHASYDRMRSFLNGFCEGRRHQIDLPRQARSERTRAGAMGMGARTLLAAIMLLLDIQPSRRRRAPRWNTGPYSTKSCHEGLDRQSLYVDS